MARPSKIDKLGTDVKRSIARWRDNGLTIDQIRKLLDDELGVDVSRSGLGRHLQGYDQMVAEIRASREAANQIVGDLGDAPDDQMARFNQEMTEALISKVFAAARGEDGQIDPKTLKVITEIQHNLARAKKHGFDLELAKTKWLEEQRKKLADIEAASANRNGGKADPVEVLNEVRAIYGWEPIDG